MIRWMSENGRMMGFLYYPLSEVAFGWFAMITAAAVPILFFFHNGFKRSQWPEWLFCAVFFIFFFWMGKNLVFQSFEAEIIGNQLHIYHNLREPPVRFNSPLSAILSFDCKTEKYTDETYLTLSVVTAEAETEIYRSISLSEIDTLKNALESLHQNSR